MAGISSLRPYHRAADRTSTVSYLGGEVALLAKSEDTGGRFTLMSGEVKQGSEPPPHVHEWEDEFYYVLKGEMEVYCGTDVFRACSGEVVFLPQGIPHAFNCVTCSIRVLVQAQATREQGVTSDRFLLQLAKPAADTDDPAARVMKAAAENGIRFLSPDEVANALPSYPGVGTSPKSTT